MGTLNTLLRRDPSTGEEGRKQQLPIRMSGTEVETLSDFSADPSDGELGDAIGRQGNDVKTPDADFFLINQVNGQRLQDFANSHLGEGPKPGRIPRRWTNLVRGVLGEHITGSRDEAESNTGVVKANQSGGSEDALYIPHIPIVRGTGMARAFARTVDDSAAIPAIYVADPTRR